MQIPKAKKTLQHNIINSLVCFVISKDYIINTEVLENQNSMLYDFFCDDVSDGIVMDLREIG
jgi:hypothetical protein